MGAYGTNVDRSYQSSRQSLNQCYILLLCISVTCVCGWGGGGARYRAYTSTCVYSFVINDELHVSSKLRALNCNKLMGAWTSSSCPEMEGGGLILRLNTDSWQTS